MAICKSPTRLWLSPFCLVPFICGFSDVAVARDYCSSCCALLRVYSDPPGGRVYDEDGDDWGVTTESQPVDVFLSHSYENGCETKWPYKITVQDRQHGATTH